MKNLFNTTWTINKASDYKYNEERMIYTPDTFTVILTELYEKFGSNIIVDFDDCTLTIYDDYVE